MARETGSSPVSGGASCNRQNRASARAAVQRTHVVRRRQSGATGRFTGTRRPSAGAGRRGPRSGQRPHQAPAMSKNATGQTHPPSAAGSFATASNQLATTKKPSSTRRRACRPPRRANVSRVEGSRRGGRESDDADERDGEEAPGSRPGRPSVGEDVPCLEQLCGPANGTPWRWRGDRHPPARAAAQRSGRGRPQARDRSVGRARSRWWRYARGRCMRSFSGEDRR